MREVGKVFGFGEDARDALSGTIWGWSSPKASGTGGCHAASGSIRTKPRTTTAMALVN
jgi:hypothetical protein